VRRVIAALVLFAPADERPDPGAQFFASGGMAGRPKGKKLKRRWLAALQK
jgi:hypothetical protein